MSEKLENLLAGIGLEKYLDRFLDAEVDLDILAELDSTDFRELGVSLGDQRRISRELERLAKPAEVVERRLLSLLFIDVVGSSQMAVQMDAEDYRNLMFEYQDLCEKILIRKGGHLARKFGDGILAYFGFPQSRENDARHAAEAALEIVEDVSKLKVAGQDKLQVRIGIATGMSLVDEILSDDGRERGQVFGEPPNLAARLQHLASPNTILICEQTHRALSRYFETEYGGAHEVKGWTEPMPVWSVEAQSNLGQQKVRNSNGNGRFLNRESEIEIVRSSWAKVLNSQGQLIVLEGCAGIGKSALIGHLIDTLHDENAHTVYLKCEIDQRGRPLHPFAKYFEQEIALSALYSNASKEIAAKEWLTTNVEGSDHSANIFDAILNAKQSAQGTLDSAEMRAQIFEFLFRYTGSLHAERPVKLVVEDLQWIDPTTLEFLGEIAETIDDQRMLLLCSQRDDSNVEIPNASPHILQLEALSDTIATKIVDRELESIEVPASLKSQIVNRCDGIPLYIEEVTRAVIDNARRGKEGKVAIPEKQMDLPSGELPTSLLGPLLSRLDSRVGARQVASFASAIGRRFSVSMLEQLIDMPRAQIEEVLSELVAAQIIKRLEAGREIQFEFGHAVMQDAAYQILLKDKRQEAHAKIAQALEADFQDTPEAQSANIAYHYNAAENWEQACSFWMKAAGEMQAFGAHREAISYCEQALNANSNLASSSDESDVEIGIRDTMRVSQEMAEWWSPQYMENLEKIQSLREEKGETHEYFGLLNGLAGSHLLLGRFGLAKQFAEKILSLSGEEEIIQIVLAERMIGICEFYSAEFDESIKHLEKAKGLASTQDEEEMRKFYYADVALVSEVFILWSKILKSKVDVDKNDLSGVEADIFNKNHSPSRLYGHGVYSSCMQVFGDAEACLKHAKAALDLASELEQPYWSAWSGMMIGWAEASLGELDTGIARIEAALADFMATGKSQIVPYGKFLLAEALYLKGLHAKATEIVGEISQKDAHELEFITPMVAQLQSKLRQ